METAGFMGFWWDMQGNFHEVCSLDSKRARWRV